MKKQISFSFTAKAEAAYASALAALEAAKAAYNAAVDSLKGEDVPSWTYRCLVWQFVAPVERAEEALCHAEYALFYGRIADNRDPSNTARRLDAEKAFGREMIAAGAA